MELSNISYVYGLVSTRDIFNIKYIGISNNPKKRLSCHIKESNKLSCHRHNWINKEIREGFKIIIKPIQIYPENIIYKKEVTYIKLFKKLGYNLTNSNEGGLGGNKPNEETRRKMSVSKLGNTWNKGRQPSDYNKLMKWLANKNKKLSSEQKQKMLEGKKRLNFINKGSRNITDEEIYNILIDNKKGIKPKELSIKYNKSINKIYRILYRTNLYREIKSKIC